MIVKYLIFPRGNRPYGGGGWSSSAKNRPLPELVIKNLPNSQIRFVGKSVFINGERKLKVNVFTNRGKIIRQDYGNIGFKTTTI
jgi:hypothetical protein